jgi:hypothetical protein
MLTMPCFAFHSKNADCPGRVQVVAGTTVVCPACNKSLPASVYLNAHLVTLDKAEMLWGKKVGIERDEEAKKQGRKPAYGCSEAFARAELAFAKFWGVTWDASVNTYKLPDVGDIQVRCRSRHGYDLIVRPLDIPETPTALVTGQGPAFYVRGWILAGDADEPEWRDEHGNRDYAYFVPATALRPMDELRALAG